MCIKPETKYNGSLRSFLFDLSADGEKLKLNFFLSAIQQRKKVFYRIKLDKTLPIKDSLRNSAISSSQ